MYPAARVRKHRNRKLTRGRLRHWNGNGIIKSDLIQKGAINHQGIKESQVANMVSQLKEKAGIGRGVIDGVVAGRLVAIVKQIPNQILRREVARRLNLR